jgi:hypothetical protein
MCARAAQESGHSQPFVESGWVGSRRQRSGPLLHRLRWLMPASLHILPDEEGVSGFRAGSGDAEGVGVDHLCAWLLMRNTYNNHDESLRKLCCTRVWLAS